MNFSVTEFIRMAGTFWPYFQTGIIYTLIISICSVIIGTILAFGIVSLRMAKFRILRFLAGVYIEFFRGTPMIVQIMIIHLGVFAGVRFPSYYIFGFIDLARFIPGLVAVSLNSAAYVSELIRAGILAVDVGQTEAARSLGMTKLQTMRFVVLPQAIKNILPALGNELIVVIKETSILSVIGAAEIMYSANLVIGATYLPTEPLIMAAILYLLLTYPSSKLIAYFERRMRRGDVR